ncbi:MAG TPA: transcription antitermination factor NusB [Acidiferrobacteraceae bacterium]|nr:transcription antitermination factor NusB [Acidiferrobacteraceae bacterium]
MSENPAAVRGGRKRARQAAVQALYQWQLTAQQATDIERLFLHDQDLKGVDQEYFRCLVREVPLHLAELDAQLAPHLDRTMDEIDPVERAILRIGACEFAYHPEIPYRVVLNEAIELAKTFGAEHGHRYVNAVLDKLAAGLRQSEVARP